MISRFSWPRWLPIVLVGAAPAASAAQTLYLGAGLGPTVVVDAPSRSNTIYRGFYGAIGVEWPRGVGVRLEGTETWSYLWVSADFTYRFASRTSRLQPYALAGGGVRMDLDDADPIATAGLGARLRPGGPLWFFGEGRLHYVPGARSDPLSIDPRTFVLWTLGVTVAL